MNEKMEAIKISSGGLMPIRVALVGVRYEARRAAVRMCMGQLALTVAGWAISHPRQFISKFFHHVTKCRTISSYLQIEIAFQIEMTRRVRKETCAD